MERSLKIREAFDSLDKLFEELKKTSPYDVSMEYDSWDIRIDARGEMEKCILLKKSSMHGLKMYFDDKLNLQACYVIPNKFMNAYLGKSQKKYRNILEILSSKLLSLAISGQQKKAFDEMIQTLSKVAN